MLQAACAHSTIVPHLEQHLNFSLGCYGCREATDLGPGESVIGFPGTLLETLLIAVSAVRPKAVPRSPSKSACASLTKRISAEPEATPAAVHVGAVRSGG